MRFFVFTVAIFCLQLTWAQPTDTSTSHQFFGQWRSYYLGTFNQGDLSDFHGLATGGKVGFRFSKGPWSVQTVGYTSANLNVQDLRQPDAETGRLSRYELGLFDVNDPGRRLIVILGEAYLEYAVKGHMIKAGRMKFKSPLINPQDGRMIPTLTQGATYKYVGENKLIFQTTLLNAIATRSTDRFERIGDTIGLYPAGRNPDGSRSQYYGQTGTEFIWINHLGKSFGSSLKANLWNYHVDKVFNTTYARLNWKPGKTLGVAVEGVHQRKVAHGGNEVDSLTYFFANSSTMVGTEISYHQGNQSVKIGYNHILAGGRFLFPREWGREGIFTFQKRERSEGSADNHALLATYELRQQVKELKIRGILSVGHQWKADVTNAPDNKYALPSYRHINLDWFFEHTKLKSLKPELLLTYKQGIGDFPDNPNFILNKVDLFQVNCIFNYNF